MTKSKNKRIRIRETARNLIVSSSNKRFTVVFNGPRTACSHQKKRLVLRFANGAASSEFVLNGREINKLSAVLDKSRVKRK